MTDTMTIDADRPPQALLERRARALREGILAACLAVIEAGEEPTMRAVAAASGISERTIYRYFASRELLYEALMPLVGARAGAPVPAGVDGLPDYVRALFGTFEQNRALVSALVTAPWAAPALEHSRAANRAALLSALRRDRPFASEASLGAAASALRVLVSGAGWKHLSDCGLEPEEKVVQGQWLVRAVLRQLDEDAGRPSWKQDR